MAALSLTNFTDFVERKYIRPQAILMEVLKSTPFLGLINKDKTMGDYTDLPINYAAPAGVSSSYTVAVAGQAPGKYGKFTVQPKLIYAYGKVANEAIRAAAAKNDRVLQVKPLTNEMDNLMLALKLQIGANVMGNHGMALGRALSTPGGTDYHLHLKNPFDHYKFHVGMQIVASVADGTSGALRDADHCTITEVNRNAADATITTDTGYWTTIITGLVADDYLFAKGSWGTGVYGLDSWVPKDRTILGTPFCGITRSVDSENLAGWHISATGMAIEEAINYAVAVCSIGGSRPTTLLINPMDQKDVLNAYKGATRPNVVMATGQGNIAKIGYEAVRVDTVNGPLDVIADRFVEKGYLRLITPSSFVFLSAGEPFKFLPLNQSGDIFRTTPAGEDSTEFTIVGQIQTGCNAPGKNAVIQL